MANSKNLVAVGLRYDGHRDDTPVVAVKGEHALADEVVKIAKRFNVPVMEEPELARAANEVPLDQQIPKNLFRAVAILLNRLEKSRK